MTPAARRTAVTAVAAVVPLGGALLYFVAIRDAAIAQRLYTATKVFTVVWPLLATRYLLREKVGFGHRPVATILRSAPLGLATGAVLVAVLWVAWQTPLRGVVLDAAPAIRDKAATLGIADHYWAFALLLSVVHSGIEEMYWRWFVFGNFERLLPAAAAHVLAGAAFGAHHVVIATQFFPGAWGWILGAAVGLGGILWSLQYRRQGTVSGAWVSHLLVDLGLMTIGYEIVIAF